MPNNDGTGPFGDGRPGKGLGACGRNNRGCFKGSRGFRQGFGQHRRRYWCNGPAYTTQAEGNSLYAYNRLELETRKNELEQQLKWLNEQLSTNKED